MLHTSESLKALEADFENGTGMLMYMVNVPYQLDDGEQYKLTDDELDWLKSVSNRYAIADHIYDNLDSNGVYTVDAEDMTEALEFDGCEYAAVYLRHDSVLAKIFYNTNLHIEA